MLYKCVLTQQDERWLTIGKLYVAEICVSPKEFSGNQWIFITRADDGFPAYARLNQFELHREERDALGV